MSDELRKRALALYKPPFSYHCGYIHDGEGNMVSDAPAGAIVTRVRGWGRISYLENAEELQDTVGEMIAEALYNTALGIGTSAIAIIFYNIFTTKIDAITYGIDESGFTLTQSFASLYK